MTDAKCVVVVEGDGVAGIYSDQDLDIKVINVNAQGLLCKMAVIEQLFRLTQQLGDEELRKVY